MNHSELGNFDNLFFSIIQVWVLRLDFSCCSFWFILRIRIRIQEAEILRIQQIRILSTVSNIFIFCLNSHQVQELRVEVRSQRSPWLLGEGRAELLDSFILEQL